MTAERIVEALASAELMEVLMPDSQAVDAKTRTNGDLNTKVFCNTSELR